MVGCHSNITVVLTIKQDRSISCYWNNRIVRKATTMTGKRMKRVDSRASLQLIESERIDQEVHGVHHLWLNVMEGNDVRAAAISSLSIWQSKKKK